MESNAFLALQHEVQDFVEGPAVKMGLGLENGSIGPMSVWDELKRRGYLRLAAPESLGGLGLSMGQYLTLLEKFSAMHGSMRMIVHVMNGIWRPVHSHASLAQTERFVKPLIQGEHIITFTLTEPNAGTGSDIKTQAYRDGNDYVLNGEKWLITFADVADYFLLFARLAGSRGSEGTLALLVDRDSPGLEIELMPASMGLSGT